MRCGSTLVQIQTLAERLYAKAAVLFSSVFLVAATTGLVAVVLRETHL